jgi:hypothetical protein
MLLTVLTNISDLHDGTELTAKRKEKEGKEADLS